MKTPFLAALVFLATLVTLPAGAAEVVRVYNWSDYIDEEILTEFTRETGIKVIYDVYESNEMLEAKLLAGKSGYDVVVPSDSFLRHQIDAGVYQKLNPALLPNRRHMWPLIEKYTEIFDPGNSYSVNYMWGTTGIGYNVDQVRAVLGIDHIESWDVLFQENNLAKLASCGVHFLDAPLEVFPAALNYLGKSPNSRKIADYRAVASLLQPLTKHIRKFHSSEYTSALANGDICIAFGWSGDVFQARDRADEADNGIVIDYIAPKEGAVIWFDQLAIPADAPNVVNAHKFINYLMRPDVIAKASNYLYYANGNIDSQPLLEDDVIHDLAIYPDDQTMNNLFVAMSRTPKVRRVMNRLWQKIKSGV